MPRPDTIQETLSGFSARPRKTDACPWSSSGAPLDFSSLDQWKSSFSSPSSFATRTSTRLQLRFLQSAVCFFFPLLDTRDLCYRALGWSVCPASSSPRPIPSCLRSWLPMRLHEIPPRLYSSWPPSRYFVDVLQTALACFGYSPQLSCCLIKHVYPCPYMYLSLHMCPCTCSYAGVDAYAYHVHMYAYVYICIQG